MRCDAAERRRHAAFLAAETPIKQLGATLANGQLELYRATVVSLRALANADTIFGNLGLIYAQNETGREVFRVGEVRGILFRDDCTDRHGPGVVRRAMQAAAAGTLPMDLVVNLLYDGRRLRVVDGNHRAAGFAAHHLDAGSDDAIDLRVYVLAPTGVAVPARSLAGG